MLTEKLLARTKDNAVIVFDVSYNNVAEKTRLKLECESICASVDYNDFNSSLIRSAANIKYDTNNTKFIHTEVNGYHYRKDRARFYNGLLTDPPAQADTMYLSHRVPDDAFPEMLKNLGYRIEPVDETYDVIYDSRSGKFRARGFKIRIAEVFNQERRIEVVRNHFKFSHRDYTRLQELLNDYNAARRRNRNLTEREFARSLLQKRDKALMRFYAQEKEITDHLDTTLIHEAKHGENHMYADGLSLKKDAKRMTVEDYYCYAAEDERSAYMREMARCIDKYLQKGDMNDFSMFDNDNQHIVNDLKALPESERFAYATNRPNLVAKKLQHFAERHQDYYDSHQFNSSDGKKGNVEFYVDTAPLNAPEDVNHEYFKKLRSLLYTFPMYNPTTRRMEMVNLSRHITPDLEVKITPKAQQIIREQKINLRNRLNEFAKDKRDGKIDVSLIEPAKALMRGGMRNSEFVTVIDNFRITSLYEPENTPTPPVADDRADWSNELQNYWRQVAGYHEIVKNNDEYKFKINDATVSYTSKRKAAVSRNAGYDLYVKLLQEPSNRTKPVEFLDTLSQEQKLLLYVACVNNGRRMSGAVPTDLSAIDSLSGIPPQELADFRRRQSSSRAQTSGTRGNTPHRRNQFGPAPQISMLSQMQKRINGGR